MQESSYRYTNINFLNNNSPGLVAKQFHVYSTWLEDYNNKIYLNWSDF